MRRRRKDENGAQEVVELAALADGTLVAGASRGARGTVGGVVGAHRATRRATAGGQAHAECDGRHRGTSGTAGAHRGSATRAPLRSAASPARDRSLRGRRAGGRHGAERVRFRRLSRAIPRRACSDCAPSRRQGRRETHKDIVGLADRARRHRDPPTRERALLPGMAAQHRRRTRSHRDVQRGPEGHALGRRAAD